MSAITSLVQNVDEKTEFFKKELRRLKKGVLFFVIVSLAGIGVITGYFVSSDMLLGPFRRISYAMLSPSSMELDLETTSPMRTRIEYGTSKDYMNQKWVSPSYSKIHTTNLDGLLPGKTHMVRFVAEDQSGRRHVSAFYSVE